jgi:hypothetical protein
MRFGETQLGGMRSRGNVFTGNCAFREMIHGDMVRGEMVRGETKYEELVRGETIIRESDDYLIIKVIREYAP